MAPKIKPIDVLKFIHENELQNILPNLVVALQIFLTLPVTVASNERSFSKLKLIKNYLRSTMSQERLSGLAVLSIEKEETENLDLNELVNLFAKTKARHVNFKQ